jgi:predicted nucleic-acid-binding Zn-ribbon protein
MERNRECPNCGSRDIVSSVRVLDMGDGVHMLSLLVEEKPHATILRGWRRFPLTASVCGNCGYTELRLTDPAGFREAHQRAQDSPAAFTPALGPARAMQSPSAFLLIALSLSLLIGLGILAVFLASFR